MSDDQSRIKPVECKTDNSGEESTTTDSSDEEEVVPEGYNLRPRPIRLMQRFNVSISKLL